MNKLSDALRALPTQLPPPGGWVALQRRMRAERRQSQARFTGFAAAASMLLATGLWFWQPKPGAELPQVSMSQLLEQSRQLETTLAQVRPQARHWSSESATRAVSLSNQLALVDLQLNYAEDAGAERLWQNRVDLMSQLVQAHRQAAAGPAQTDDKSQEDIAI